MQLNVCKSVLDWSGQGPPPVCPTACMNNLDTLRTLPNVRRFACCDCGEGAQGMLCRMERRKIEAACGSSGFDCNEVRLCMCPCVVHPCLLNFYYLLYIIICLQRLQMCPSRPRPHGVVDCYTIEGMCARDSTCASLVLDAMQCVTDEGVMMTPECRDAQRRIFSYLMENEMSPNCTCITSPVQCRKFRAAIGMPVEVSPGC